MCSSDLDVTVVPAPTGSNRRVIKDITIYNGDSAAVTVYVKYDNNATQRTLAKVVLAVGDTHVFRVDKPLYYDDRSRLVEHVTRVEAFGSPHIHWVKVTVDPDSPEVFQFKQQLIMENFRPSR